VTSVRLTAGTGAADCPQCRAPLVVSPGFSSWCEKCGWNSDPVPDRSRPPKRTDRIYGVIGARAHGSLLSQVKSEGGTRPRLTLGKVLAIAIALSIHLLTIALVVGGVLLLISGNFLLAAFGGLSLGLAWLFRPRAAPGPKEPPADAPHLRRLADDIARAVGARPADVLIIDADFNASVNEVGWRRRRVLKVGLPLMAVLEPQERVAVLGHEFGHFVNGDPRRGFVVATAFETLTGWLAVLSPDRPYENEVLRESGLGLLEVPARIVMSVISIVPLVIGNVLYALIARESRRAEYLADVVAARLAGSQALASFFDKLHLQAAYVNAMAAKKESAWLEGSFWKELRHRADNFPESEQRRARVRDRARATRMDVTHPPTSSRMEAVLARPATVAQLTLTSGRSDQIDEELLRLLPAMQRDIVDRHVDTLYAG
jgi:Zn-dependent protease with chaperone function